MPDNARVEVKAEQAGPTSEQGAEPDAKRAKTSGDGAGTEVVATAGPAAGTQAGAASVPTDTVNTEAAAKAKAEEEAAAKATKAEAEAAAEAAAKAKAEEEAAAKAKAEAEAAAARAERIVECRRVAEEELGGAELDRVAALTNEGPFYPFFASFGGYSLPPEEKIGIYGTSMEHLTDAQLKAEWSKTVRDSAKQVGRANSNIKRYLGESVVNRQIEAVGARGLRALLAIVASGDISTEKREVVSSILSSAKKALKQADVGSVAAFSAVNAVYGVLDGGAGTQAE